jgi:hypothetical protein
LFRCRTLPAGQHSKEQTIVSAQHAEEPGLPASPLKTVGDIRAALQSHDFPEGRESFEADLQRALEASSERDSHAVATVLVDYRGRIRLCQDPDFNIAVQEGIDLAACLKLAQRP